jgi:hypothetical protein
VCGALPDTYAHAKADICMHERMEASPMAPSRAGSEVTVLTRSRPGCMQELLGQKKDMHINSFRLLIDELSRDLRRIADEGDAEARLASDSERMYGKYRVHNFLQRIVGLAKEVLRRHERRKAEDYTDDGVFKGLVQEMLATRTMAESLLRLYLEDRSRGIFWRMTMTSLREAHRELIAFRTRMMAGLEGEARRAAAERLCILRGFAAQAVGETNDAGEDALVRAAADGTAGAAGVALLLAAGAATGGEALVAAAKHGQREAVAALIECSVDVDWREAKVRGDGVALA